MGIDPASLPINRITCVGEPGAGIPSGIPSTKKGWKMPGARVYDHSQIDPASFSIQNQLFDIAYFYRF